MTPLARRRMLVEALSISAAFWLAFLALVLLFGGRWPHGTFTETPAGRVDRSAASQWATLAVLWFVCETLWVKAWLMFRRTGPGQHSRLGWSLICFNAGFLAVYAWSIAVVFWPRLRVEHRWLTGPGPLYWVALWCAWAAVELALSRDPERGGLLERRRNAYERRSRPPPPRPEADD